MTTSLDERPVFLGLASLLPGELAEQPVGFWDIGEQEAAIEALTDALAEAGARVTSRQRAELAAVAESWSQWETVATRVYSLPAATPDQAYCELLQGPRADALNAGLPHPLAGREPVVWAVCARCDDLLVRLYERGPRGIVPPAARYAVVSGPDTGLYDDTLAAFDALTERCLTR